MKRTKTQNAPTDGVLGGDLEPLSLFPQSFPFLEAKAAKNFPFQAPSFAATATAALACLLHSWSAGNRCLRQTLRWQVLQVLQFEKVRICLHLVTGHLGFFFFLGSQFPDLLCLSSNTFWLSSPSWPVVSMEVEHTSQTITFRLL